MYRIVFKGGDYHFFKCQILEQSMLAIPYVIVIIIFTHSVIPWDSCLCDFL